MEVYTSYMNDALFYIKHGIKHIKNAPESINNPVNPVKPAPVLARRRYHLSEKQGGGRGKRAGLPE
jgi:hypothetical protein